MFLYDAQPLNRYPSEVSGLSMNFPITATIHRIRQKSAESMTAITNAGTHFEVHGTNKTNGT